MAFVQKELIWEPIYPKNYDTVEAKTVIGKYVIEKCLGAECLYDDDENVEYRWGYDLYNGKKGYLIANSYEIALANVQRHFEQEMTYSFDIVTAYGAPYIAELTATGISGAIENDTVEIVIGSITYTFTANAEGIFIGEDFVATGGDADDNLSFEFDQSVEGETITVTNSLESFTVTSYTITLDGTPTEITDAVEATATEI